MHAVLFWLNYVAFAEDGTLDITPPTLDESRDGENAEDAQLRVRAEMLLYETRMRAGSWRDLCADELRQIPPSWASAVAKCISWFGLTWLDEAAARDSTIGRPAADVWVRGARPLLGAMCPSQHWTAALDLMDMRAIAMDPEWRAGAEEPVALIHAAAAMTTWLFRQPEIVPDPHATKQALMDQAEQYAR